MEDTERIIGGYRENNWRDTERIIEGIQGEKSEGYRENNWRIKGE